MSRQRPLRRLGLWLPVLVLLVVQLLPVALVVLTSFKTAVALMAGGPLGLEGFYLGNYSKVVVEDGFLGAMGTSAVIALGTTVLAILAGAPAAYALARLRLPGKTGFKAALVISRVLPPVALAVPLFMLLKFMGLTDTIPGLILAHTTVCLPFAIWLLIPFFAGLPRELEEAAALDGCGPFLSFRLAVLPLAMPGLVVAATFCFLASWNDFLFALVIAGSATKTAPLTVNGYMTGFGPEWGPLTASSVLILVPALVLSLLLQRHMVGGLTTGGVKD